MDKHSPMYLTAEKLENILNSFKPDKKSLKIKHKRNLRCIPSLDSIFKQISHSTDLDFNGNIEQKHLKTQVSLKKITNEKEKKILDLFKSSSNSSNIEPEMLKDKTIKKILSCNKRPFGHQSSNILPDIPTNLDLKSPNGYKTQRKTLKNNLYINGHQNASLRSYKGLENKNFIPSLTPRSNINPIFENKEIDAELKERIDKCTLEYGQLKHKLGRSLMFRIDNRF
jgi:hypothetical protein